MVEAARRLAVWEDLLALPEGDSSEIIGGELIGSPRPGPHHNHAQTGLAHLLGGPFDLDPDGPSGWWILIEPDVAFGPHDIVNPDLGGWRRERLPRLPGTRPLTVTPDWVCEVLSPSTARTDRLRKADLYLRSGVPFYWMVDVDARILEAFEARAGLWVRLGSFTDGDRPRIPPFDAVALDVGRLFPAPE